jgi:hypothetical protein
MKIQKYISLLMVMLVITFIISSCTKGFEEMNKPYNQANSANVAELYNSVVSSMQINYQEQATYHSFIYEITQQATQHASSGYRMENASGEMWQTYFTMLANSKLIDTMISVNPDKANMTNILAMNRTLRVYKTIRTTENFGDIPFSEAGYAIYGTDYYKPKYDSQEEVYKACINDLKWAVDNFSTSADQVKLGSYETFLKDDIAMWKKFANSFRLRCAVTMYDKDPAFAGPHIADALTKPLLADGDDIGLWPAEIPGLVFDMHAWSFSANQYIRMGTTMWDHMSVNDNTDGSGIFDPRCKIFFEGNNAGAWVAYPQNPTASTPSEGGDPYNDLRDNDWPNKGSNCKYSPLNYYFKDKTYIPELMITAAEVHLFKAEIYNRGLGVAKNSATAKLEYEAGVTASCNFWYQIAIDCPKWVVNKPASLPSASQIATLLANPKVAYNTGDEAAALKQIYTQMWVDGFRQPWDVWTLYRRNGGNLPKDPDNPSYTENNYGIYHRYTYAATEQDYNSDSWHAAMGGSDTYGTKIWLEK